MTEGAENSLPAKQLSMTAQANQIRLLPDAVVPEQYVLRLYRRGDENSWVDLLQMGCFSKWDRARMEQFLDGPERRDGSRVVAYGNQIVAATFASRREGEDNTGVLDFVISHTDHRGFGLGRAVCTAVSKYLVDRGYEQVNLHTNDWRLEAISLYLSMGFVPDMTREDMPSRWGKIMQNLESLRK